MPDLPAGYRAPLPDARPTGLRGRRVGAGAELWRVEAVAPAQWTWTGFPHPRFRFDPESGAFRTRYAASTLVGAFRERYRPTGLMIPADHAGHHLVRLVAARHLRVLDLRTEANLDVLGVDDQISTGRHSDVWQTCHRLADAVKRWWPPPDTLDALAYRPRTTPETSVNYAFFAPEAFSASSRPVEARVDVLTNLVLRHGFTVGWELDGK
ncbi:RES domain-containing protein [Candidatus Mycobacterium methanotrophicum]|uniref:RES domain-containing protein n=1 Tax=Candidatus Mycobacterium methanotrophicum TaxID=2943498 RepID=A0ABY4QP52_9MYCO|nr:RES domain-containing protein [Candidatus Mycobacterium methanotrophicum]UQX12083.1 RES domain-containing protein [Candidatus Mycobacterium methanotrophicum]